MNNTKFFQTLIKNRKFLDNALQKAAVTTDEFLARGNYRFVQDVNDALREMDRVMTGIAWHLRDLSRNIDLINHRKGSGTGLNPEAPRIFRRVGKIPLGKRPKGYFNG